MPNKATDRSVCDDDDDCIRTDWKEYTPCNRKARATTVAVKIFRTFVVVRFMTFDNEKFLRMNSESASLICQQLLSMSLILNRFRSMSCRRLLVHSKGE